MNIRRFGSVGGQDVVEVAIGSAGGAEARIITWGAVLRDLSVPVGGRRRTVVLGLDDIDDYVGHSPNFGAVIGRYANRIGQARFRLDGRDVTLVPNEDGNALHGGPAGFGRRIWSLLGHDARRAHLGLVSEDGDMGYPGRLVATASYEFVEPATMRITLQAFADRPTPVNLTAHTYFNLDGSRDVRAHILAVPADLFTPTDAALIPTGAIAPVDGTPFDFRIPRPILGTGPYQDCDVNLVIRRARNTSPRLAHACTLASPTRDLAMELWTTEPGLQVYDGHLVDVPGAGPGGKRFGRYAGLALEPQRFPDGPNRAHFPPCILEPGAVSSQASELRFTVSEGP